MAEFSKETLALLGRGHVWRRVDTGRQSTVLYLTNTELKGAAAKRNPPSVTYMDDKGKINSVTVESYIEKREYITINVYIEDMLTRALQEPPVEPEASYDAGEPESEPELPEGITQEDVDQVTQLFESQLKVTFTLSGEAPPVIDPITLASSILQYEQDPDINLEAPHKSHIRHKMVVALNGFTTNDLNAVFTPSDNGSYYSEFSVNGISVDWNSYLGAYVVASPDGIFASVVFSTPMEGDFGSEEDESVGTDGLREDLGQAPSEDSAPVIEPQPEPEIVPPEGQPSTVLNALLSVASPVSDDTTEEDPPLKIIDDEDEPVVVAGQGNSAEDDQREDTAALFGTAPAKPTVQPQGLSAFQFQPHIVRK